MNIPFLENVKDNLKNTKSLKLEMNYNNWGFEHNTKATCFLGHDKNNIFLHYFVSSDEIKATYKNFCDPVYEESCVEFFVSFDKKNYYNFEFNSLGTILAFYGPNRDSRVKNECQNLVKTLSSIKDPIISQGKIEWDLFACLPKSVFFKNDFKNELYFNLYSCGDKLQKPFYLSAFKVDTKNPDFHRVEFFKMFNLSSK